MPRKSDSIPINDKALDKRVKVSDDTKELIRWLHEEEKPENLLNPRELLENCVIT
jgi:hypothetical protein